MIAEYRRYAVYYTPASAAWADFAVSWLGWDLERGAAVDHPPAPGLDVGAITARARRYGFHATLKAPFRLEKGSSATQLEDALLTLAASRAPVVLRKPVVTLTGGFVAVVPDPDDPALPDLAALEAAVVRDLDGFRAPLGEEELARRRAAGLAPRQEALLARWGYPYVLDAFRFHMTLTDRLSPSHRDAVLDLLRDRLGALLPERLPIDALSLVAEGQDGMFRLLRRCPLRLDTPP